MRCLDPFAHPGARRRRALAAWRVLSLALLHAHGAGARRRPTPRRGVQLRIAAAAPRRMPRRCAASCRPSLTATRSRGRPDLETVVEGNASCAAATLSIRADRLEYDQPDDLPRARGNVRINQAATSTKAPSWS